MTNTFKKYAAGVFCMQSESPDYEHGQSATITTKYGKEITVTVWKKLFTKNSHTFYSVVRDDGFNRTEWKKRKAERAANAAQRQARISQDYYEKSQEGKDFLVLAEPIKIGHHSEKRHRALIDRNWARMGKSVQASDKAKEYESRAAELEHQAEKEINLDTPECLDLLCDKVARLEKQRDDLKASGSYESWQLSNLGANIRRYKERLDTARKLWDLEQDAAAPSAAQLRAEDKRSKQERMNALLEKHGVIWAFSQQQFDANKKEGVKYARIGAGGYIPADNVEAFLAEFKEF